MNMPQRQQPLAYWLVMYTIVIALAIIVIGQLFQAQNDLQSSKRSFTQTICDVSRNTTHDFQACYEAENSTHTEYLCDVSGKCWTEDK